MEGPSAADRPVGDRLHRHDPDDPRLEEGFQATAEAETGDTRVSDARDVEATGAPGKVDAADEASDTGASDSERPTANLWSPRTLSPPQLRRMSMTR
mgnify:CR=1 FL=1